MPMMIQATALFFVEVVVTFSTVTLRSTRSSGSSLPVVEGRLAAGSEVISDVGAGGGRCRRSDRFLDRDQARDHQKISSRVYNHSFQAECEIQETLHRRVRGKRKAHRKRQGRNGRRKPLASFVDDAAVSRVSFHRH